MLILTIVGAVIIYGIKDNRGDFDRNSTITLDSISQTLQPQSVVADSSAQFTQESEAVTPSEASASAGYTCRECGKEIPWIGSFKWTMGPDSADITEITDNTYEGDERIDTPLYSEEMHYSRGIFCSYKCADRNLATFDYNNTQ